MMNRERGSSILAGMLPAAAVAALVGGAVVYDMGAVRVSVDEKGKDGTSIHLVVPAALVSAGIHLVPDRELRKAAPEMGDEMRQWLPVLRAAAAVEHRDLVPAFQGILNLKGAGESCAAKN